MTIVRRALTSLSVCTILLAPPALAKAGGEPWRAMAEEARAALVTAPKAAFALAQAIRTSLPERMSRYDRQEVEVTVLWLQGESLLQQGEVAASRTLIDRAHSLARSTMPQAKIFGSVLLSSAGVGGAQGQVARALQDAHSAFRIFQRVGDARSQAVALVCIADLYSNGKDYTSALRYLGQARETHDADPKLLMSIYNNRGTSLAALGRDREAATQFGEALLLARRMRSPALEAQIQRNILRAQLADDRLDVAAQTAQEAMAAATRAGGQDDPAMLSAIAQFALQRGRPAEALALVDRAFAGADLSITPMPAREAHFTAYRVYRAAGRDSKALAHLAAVKRLDDEATKLATQASTALMGARFDFANQELRIAKLKAEELRRSVRFEQDRARTLRWTFAVLGAAATVVVLLLTFGLFTIRRSRNAVRAANADLAVTNSALGKALAAKTEFLATTSHEIRTPLNGILGMTEVMLTDRALPDEARERIRLVHGAGTTMRALVDDILDVAKIEKGKLSLENAPYDLAEVLRDAARLWEDQIRAKGVAFELALDLPAGRVVGDAARMRQIVFNLLSNAAKFTATGAITLSATRDPDGLHRIAVADSGVGIPAGKLEEVFESFRQADASTTRRFGGTGLGLSISRNLARAMGGELTVESAPDRGSTFTLAVVLAAHEETAQVGPVAGGGDIVVIADRNPIMRAMFRNLLASHADTIVAVGDLAELLAALESHAPRAILVDDGVLAADDAAGGWAALRARADMLGAPVTLLRTTAGSPPLAPGARIVDKPVSGPALIATMFSPNPPKDHQTALVSRAA